MQVRIRYTDGREQVVVLDRHRTLRFGTRRSADVILDGGGIFPTHCGVLWHHGVFTVVASEQARKVRVNGKRVHESALHVGDRLEIGEIVLTVEDDPPELQAAPDADAALSDRNVRRRSRTVWLTRIGLGCAVLPLVTLLGVYVGQIPTADELWQRAEDAYRDEDYSRAVGCYDAFLNSHPRETESGRARTKRELAKWLSRAEGEQDAASLVTEIKAASTDWSRDDQVSVANALAQLLPPAVRHLIGLAQAREENRNVDVASSALESAQAGLDLLKGHLPDRLLQAADVDQLQADLLSLQRQRDATTALEGTLSALGQAATTADWEFARKRRATLLRAFPQWNRDTRVRDAMQQVATKLAGRVEILQTLPNMTPVEPASPAWQARVQLVGASPQETAEKRSTPDETVGPPLCIFSPGWGTVFGVDPAQGRLRSRFSIGLASPATVCELGASDCLLANAINREVSCVNLATGKVKWRVPMQADGVTSTSDGQWGIVLSRPNVTSLLSLADGAIVWQARLPQAVGIVPVLDPDVPVCYVVAEESQIFALSRDTGACLSVIALGHGLGTVWARPTLVGDYLVMVEQLGTELSGIHVLRRGDTLQSVQTLEVSGTLTGMPQQIGDVVYLPADRGIVWRLRFHPDDLRKPFVVLDPWPVLPADTVNQTEIQLVSAGDRIGIAGQGMSVFRAQDDANPPNSVLELDGDFVSWGPVRLRGDRLVALGSPATPLVPQLRAWDVSQQGALWSVSLGIAANEGVRATLEMDKLQISCGKDRYLVPLPQLLQSAAQLASVAPASRTEAVAEDLREQVDSVSNPIVGKDLERFAGGSFEFVPEGICCYGSDRSLLWRLALTSEPVVGVCLCAEQEIAVADAAGQVWRIDVERGEIRQKMSDVGDGLMAGPWWIQSHLVVLSRDGCLLVWE